MKGLPGPFVLDVAEDENGKLLICTNKGACSYDGTEFKILGPREGLTAPYLFHIINDSRENCFWVLASGNKVFKYKGGIFTRVFRHLDICWMDIDPLTGQKWLMNPKGQIFKCENDTATLFLMFKPDSFTLKTYLDNGFAFTFIAVGGDAFIVGTGTGFYLLSKQKQQMLPVAFFRGNTRYPREFRRSNLDILLTGNHGIYRYDRASSRVSLIYPLYQQEAIDLFEDDATGDVWLATTTGAYMFERGIIAPNRGTQFLSSYIIPSIFKDSEGLFWFGTMDNGLFNCNTHAIHYRTKGSVPAFLAKDENDVVYVVSRHGDIGRIESNRITTAGYPRQFGTDNMIWQVYSLPGNRIRMNSGISLYDYTQHTLRQAKHGEFYYCGNDWYRITEDKTVIRENGGVSQVLLTGEQIKWIDKHYPFVNWAGAPLYIDKEKRMYYFSKNDNDLYRIDFNTGKPRYKRYPIGSASTNINGLFGDSVIAICTEGKGVALLVNDSIKWINRDNGLVSDYCNKVIADGAYLWVCTNAGLSRMGLSQRGNIKSVFNFTGSNLLMNNDIKDVLPVRDSIYVASSGGVSCFSRNEGVSQQNYHCYIEKLEVNNQDTVVRSGYEFSYQQNNLNITLGQSSRQAHAGSYYRYILAPVNDVPVLIRSNIINLASLQPGSYQLFVWSRDLNGIWSAKPALLDFTIAPPFWKTVWFKLIIGLTAVCIAIGFVYAYQRRQRKKAEVEKKLIESDLRSLRLHMNPHFIFNSLTSLQSFIVTQKTAEAETYISQFSQMIRSVMSYSVVGEITLTEEVEFLKRYIELELIRFDDQFEYQVSVADEIQPDTVIIPSLLIQPLVENAIKHGLTGLNRKSSLKIHFGMEDKTLRCVVEDDGRGRSSKTAKFNKISGHISTGIKFTEERIRLLIKDDSIKPITITDLMIDGKSSGTRVVIVVPVLE